MQQLDEAGQTWCSHAKVEQGSGAAICVWTAAAHIRGVYERVCDAQQIR